MKIGLLTTSFPRFDGDVAGCFVLGFARALSERGHRIEVLAPEPAHPVTPRPTWPGIEVRWIPYLRPRRWQRSFYGDGLPDNLGRDPRAWLGLPPYGAQLWRATRRAARDWDAVVAHWAMPLGLLASHSAPGRPVLSVLHSADVHALGRLPLRETLAGALASRTRLWFVSEALRERFLSCLPEQERAPVRAGVHVAPMGIDRGPGRAEPDAKERARRAWRSTRFTVVAMSRLVPIKGLDTAIAAVARLPDAQLIVAGEGPERARLERLARASGAEVRLVGWVRGQPKRALLHAADAFVAPSRPVESGRTEGSPTAILEALACGLPVIASRSAGALIEHEHNGLITEADDPDTLAAALTRLQRDAPLRRRLSKQAEASAQPYLWCTMAPTIERMLVSP